MGHIGYNRASRSSSLPGRSCRADDWTDATAMKESEAIPYGMASLMLPGTGGSVLDRQLKVGEFLDYFDDGRVVEVAPPVGLHGREQLVGQR